MPNLLPDPTLYPSPSMAAEAPPETLAYVALLAAGGNGKRDAIGVVDTDPDSPDYGGIVGKTELPHGDNELHHFGWNACSSHLCGYAAHPHVERRYLVVPGIGSGRIHVLDTEPDPREPELVKVIEAEEVAEKTGYAFPHTVHCGPDGVFVNALGAPDGGGPGGIFLLDHETFEIEGAWEEDRGPQHLAYDFWWHLGHDAMITSEWGTPDMFVDGLDPELLLDGQYGNSLHVWDLRERTHQERLELGDEQQMVLELRPAHDPRRAFGFAGVVISLEDLSSSIWLWHREETDAGGGTWSAEKVITIPAEPADPADLPPILEPFGAVPPLLTDINLTLDDATLYASCWGTGELRRYDVSDPSEPELTGSTRIGGIVDRTAHPSAPDRPLSGGSQMVEVSRDGERIYLTNSLYSPWDDQFYPDGIDGWMAKVDAAADGIALDPDFFVEFEDGLRSHQVRLEGGDCSSDSYCYS